jgi:PAS domain S-box-containing protein
MAKRKKSAGDNTDNRRLMFYLKEGDKLIEKPLSEDSEERLRLALEAADIAILDWDLESNQVTFSDNFGKILCGDQMDFDGKYSTFVRMVHSDDRNELKSSMKKAIKQTNFFDFEFRVIWPEKEIRWMRIRGNVYLDEESRATRLMGTIHDKTDRKLALDALEQVRVTLEKRVHERTLELSETNERLREEITERKILQNELMEVSEMEQQRIGQDLHDSICQQLGGVIFMTQALYEKMGKENVESSDELKYILDQLKIALKNTRDLSRGLYPIIAEGKLFLALEDLALSMEELFNTKVILDYDRTIKFYDNIVAIHLFRIVQETLNNAIRHGRATKIQIEFKKNENIIFLKIADNGCGFPKKPNIRGMGLNIMKYRASIIGASFDLESKTGKGTTIVLKLSSTRKQAG